MTMTNLTRDQRENVPMARFATDTRRWQAVCRRDPAADGQFVFAVATTGVYCRPSCAARHPRRENVTFHESGTAAERAGFRPCRRCRPDLPPLARREAALVAQACRTIETADEPPAPSALADAAGISVSHFHRAFRRIAGVTPRAYAAAHRQRRMQTGLMGGATATETIYAAGFGSSGRFYEAAPEALGMTPSAYRDGARGETIRHAVAPCALGHVLVAATERGLCAILLGDDPDVLRTDLGARFRHARISAADRSFDAAVAEVVRFVDDPARRPDPALPLDIRGTVFQRRVWEELRRIPAGTTVTYAELARRLDHPRAVRAVAGACAANALAVVIPCHRVVGADGRLTGYRWGVARKKALLDRERGE